MAATTEKDATADSPTCPSFPEFAVICSFFEKFSTTCGIPRPSFNELQEMLENTNEELPEDEPKVTQTLIDLHVKLMRKARKTITTDKWERALAKFAHTYSQQDGWELERFGYKNSKLIVKLRLLKALLELQFDCNNRFKSEVNKLSAQELRVQPLGRDQMGLAYWCQFDPGSHLRVYREDPEEESWELVAKDRTGLVDLIDSLSSGEGQKELGLILEEENANQEAEKPVTDTGQPITNGTDANGNGGEVDGEEESGEEEEESGSGDDESEEEDEDEEEDETQQSSEGVNGVENGVKDKVSDSISVPKPTEPVSDIKETPATESTPAVTSTPVIVSTTASTSTVASSVSTPKPVSSPPVLAKISQQPAPPVLPSTTSQVSKQTHSVISTPVSQPLPASKPSVPFATATPPAPVPFASITLADSTYNSSTPTMPTNMSISFPTPSPIARVSLPTTVALPSNLTVSTSHKQRLYQPPAQVTSSAQPPAQSMPQNLSMFMPKITTAPARVPVVQNRYTMNDSSTNGLVDLSMKSDSREVRRPGSKLEEIFRTKFDSPVYRDRDCKSEILKHISAKFNGVEDLSMSAAKKPRLDSEDKKLEISEEIEEPVQYVRGAGSGADCESLPPMNGDGNGDGNRPHPFTSSHSLRAKNTPYSFSDPDDYQNRQSTSRDGLRGDEDTGSDGASCSGCPPTSESEEPSSPLEGAVGGVGVSGVYQDSSLQESCQALEELDMEDDLLVPEFSEVIEEDVMLFSGEGSGKENETGNPGISSDNECEVKEKDKEQSEKTLNDIVVTKSKIAEKSEEKEESIDMNGPNKDKSTEQADENGEVSETELENGGSPGQVDKKDGKVKEVMLTNIIEACLDHNRDTSINNTSELDKQMGSKYNDLFSAKNLGSTRKGNAAKATAEKAKNKENLKESKNKNYEKEDEKSESKSQKDSLPDEDSEQSKDVEETSNKEDKSEQDDLAKQTRGRKSRTNSQNSDEIQVPQKIRKTLEDKPPSVSSRRSTRSSSIQSTTSVDNETEKPTSKTSNKKGAAKKPQDKNSKAPEESENEEPLDDKQSNEKSEVTEDKLKSAGKRKRTAERRISKSEEESTEQEKDDEEEDEAGGKRPRLRGKMKRTRPKGIKKADPDSSDDERSVEKDKDNVDQKKSLKQENKNKKIGKPTKPEELKKDSIAKKEADKTDEDSDEEDSKPEKEDSKNNKMQSKGKTSKEDSSTKSKENDKLDKTETVGKKDVKKEDVIKDVKKEDDTKGVKKEGGSKDVKKEGVSKDVKKEGGSKDVKQEGGSKEIKKEDEEEKEDEESEEEEIPERVLRGGRTTRASMKATNNEQEKNKNKSAVQKGKNVKNNKDTKNKTENPQAKSNQNKNSTPPKGKANTKSKAKSKPSPKKGKSTPQVTKKPEPKSKSTTNTPNNVLKNNKTKAKMDKSVITIEDSTDDETAIKKENEIKSEKDEDVEIKEEDVEVKKEDVEVKKEDEDTKPKPKGRPKNKQLSRVSSADDPENESSKDTDDTKSGKKSDSEDKSEKTTDSEVKKVRPRGRPRKPPKSERTKEERDSDEDDKKSAKKKRSFLMGLTERDLKFSESLNDEDAGGRMRQSRRIAQQKIKEEAERRAIEEATLFSMKEMGKSKKKKDKSEDKLNKKKKKKESSEHEDEPFPEPATDDKKKKRKKKKKDRLKYNIDKPWLSSSCSSSENEQEEEDHFEYDYEEEYNNPGKDVSDHEFSPESDLEKDADYVPVRRARTACKKKDKEVKAGEEAEKVEEEKGDKEKAVEEDDYSCEKCGQADHPEWILLCDTCDKGYHASCLRPPLMLIPEGDWFCPPCQHAVLVTNLKQTLRTFEKSSKRRDNEELRRKRLAYVGISLANVLPDGGGNYSWKKSKKSKGKGEREDKDNRKSVSGDSSSEESSSSSSSYYEDEDEPVYQLRQRRSAGQANYRFNEYDDLINSAIQDDMDANQIAPVVSRGKDIGNIINAEEGEENVTAEAPAEGEIPKENPEAENEDSGNYKPPPMAKRPAFHLGRKKPKKLNNLDINSDDQDSDEDFKGSSEEEEESDNLGSDESGSWRGGRRQPLRRSGRARQSRIDREFINDDDSSDEPRKKKSKRMWQESESESSDGSWGRRKRKPQIRAAVRPKRSGRKGRRGGFRKKPRKFLDSDSDVPRRARVKKPKVKYSPIIDDEDMGRKTRGKKINYLEVIGTDSDDDTKGYQKVKKKASDDDDDFTLDNEEIEEELPPPPPPPPPLPPLPPAPVHKEIRKTNRIESDESEEDEEEENEDEEEENEDEEEENDEEEEEDDEEEDEGEPKAVKETEKSIGNPTSAQGSVIKSTDQLEGGVIKQTEKVEPLKLQVPEANRVPEVKVGDKIVEPKTLVKPNVPEKKNLEKVEDEEEEEDEEDSEEDEEEEEEGEEEGEEEEEEEEEDEAGEEEEEDEEGEEPAKPTVAEKKKEDEPPVLNIRVVPPQKLLAEPTLPVAPVVGKGLPQESVIRGMLQPTHFRPSNHQVPIHRVPNSSHPPQQRPRFVDRFVYGQQPPIPPQGFQPPPAAFYSPSQPGYQPPPPLQPVQPAQDDDYTDYPQPIGPLPEHTTRYPNPGVAGQTGDGEFGGLVSYFSSQHEDDLET